MLRILTAGESHGPALTAIIDGMPAGLALTADVINHDLARRQLGYGRGKRMEIETDRAEILSGIRHGKTLGTPIALLINNLDWPNWQKQMAAGRVSGLADTSIRQPRPGHADLPGALKYDHDDIRNVLERASARETTTRVAAGAVCRALLGNFGIAVSSRVTEIAGISISGSGPLDKQCRAADKSDLRCCCPAAEKRIKARIDAARKQGDSLGGIFEVIAFNVPVGLGSFTQWDLRLDARLAQAVMGIQAVKGVEIGIGFEAARRPGSKVHDEILYSAARGYCRATNNAGGIEGSMSNGEPIIVRAAMKPIATLYSPLRSVDMRTKKQVRAAVERSDICRVPSAAVIGEAMVAIELAKCMLEKFGSDSLRELKRNVASYLRQVRAR